jgi:3-dehydroquinate dehydratase-2
MTVLILNGPNLNLLGQREPEIYGSKSIEDINAQLKEKYDSIVFMSYQSNHEGKLIDRLHEQDFDACIFNPGAYSHTSIALMDAMYAISKPVVEVHISDIHQREEFRHHSFTSKAAKEMVVGQGTDGYEIALKKIITHYAD